MYEVIYQYDEDKPFEKVRPVNPIEAKQLLEEGNRSFADFFAPKDAQQENRRRFVQVAPQDVGLSDRPGKAPSQEPFAAFLSCADARVPVEFIFSQQANNLFVVRVAGNVLGEECLGSLDFAVNQLGSIRLLGALGHTGCGAVTAAVDTYLHPESYLGLATNFSLNAIVSKLTGAVRGASQALAAAYGPDVRDMPGFRQALIETSVIFNAALSANVVSHMFDRQLGSHLVVVFGVYNLEQRYVGLPNPDDGDSDWRLGLFSPPTDEESFRLFGQQTANSRFIRSLLEAEPSGETPAA